MKWKNYGLWISIASILYMVLKDLGFKIDFTEWQTYVTAIVGILAALGIISNPEKGKGFFDKLPIVEEIVQEVTEQIMPDSNESESLNVHEESVKSDQFQSAGEETLADTSKRSDIPMNTKQPHGMPPPPNEFI